MLVIIQGKQIMLSIARFSALVLAIFLFFASTDTYSKDESVTGLAGKSQTHRFRQDDYRRRYKLYTPRNAEQLTGKRALVLVIHGGGSTDRGMMMLTRKRWNELADEHGFFVAYPNAIDRLWDFGEGNTSNELDRRVNDLAYFERVIDHASAHAPIDPRRVFATGISRGGQSSYFLACNMPERIRAVMPVAMGLPEFMVNECASGPPVGVAIVNGTADPQVPYEGGWITVFRDQRDRVLSTEQTTKLWRSRNGCTHLPTSTSSIDKLEDNTSITIRSWSDCTGAPVMLYRVENGGHTWPSGLQYLGVRLVGEVSEEIDAADEGWTFFSQFD